MHYRLCCYQITSTSFISTHKILWPIRQDKQLSTHGNFKNAGAKLVRGSFHSRGTVTSKEALVT